MSSNELKEQAAMMKTNYMDAIDSGDMNIMRRRLLEWQAAERRYVESLSFGELLGELVSK